MNIAIFYLILYSLPFEVLNDSLVFSIGSKKAKILDIRYMGPPLSGYERTEPKLVGEVKNVGKGVIIGGRIEITAYGEKMHMLVNKRERKIAFWLLEPQQTSPFCIYIGDAIYSSDDIKSIKIGLKSQESLIHLLEKPVANIDKRVYHGLEIVNFGTLVDTIIVYGEPVTNHYIRGKIVNKGKRTTQANTVVALFYDEKDNLIDYKKHSIFGKLGGGEIPPGDYRIFRLDVPQWIIEYKGYRYKLNILSVVKE